MTQTYSMDYRSWIAMCGVQIRITLKGKVEFEFLWNDKEVEKYEISNITLVEIFGCD